MATTRTATTQWHGSLIQGAGQVTLESSGIGTFDVTWASRAETPNGRTSPEELIAAAHSACFSMALSHALTQGGNEPAALSTTAEERLNLINALTSAGEERMTVIQELGAALSAARRE